MKIFILTSFIFMMSVFSSSALLAKDKPFFYDDHGKRDPLWRLVSPSGMIMNYELDLSIVDLNLEGIVAGKGGDNLVIINGQVIKQDAFIGQFKVAEIHKNSVVLVQGQQRFELKLKKEE